MVWWLFKKKSDNQVDPEAIKNSFSNIKHDMNHISSWINHFKNEHKTHNKKHDQHKGSYQELLIRIEKLEKLLATTETIEEIEKQEEPIKDIPKTTPLENMSLVEQRICSILFALQNENAGGWVSLKKLAEDAYPQKDYKESRSYVSQMISKLELEGFITKKRMGKFVYIHLNKKIKELFINKAKTKKKPKSPQKDS